MNKILRQMAAILAAARTENESAEEVVMSPMKLDTYGELVIDEKGGFFTPNYDADNMIGFVKKMNVGVRDNGHVAFWPVVYPKSRAREIVKTPHGKVCVNGRGDLLVNFRFGRDQRGNIMPQFSREAGEMLHNLNLWEMDGEKFFNRNQK